MGSKSQFNAQGFVPVNRTEQDISQFQDNFLWKTKPLISIASRLAGLFHDIGKANVLFQNKLNPNIQTPVFEPYRHEWISLRLFLSLVGNANSDDVWLDKLIYTQFDDFCSVFKDSIDKSDRADGKILSALNNKFPPLAQLIAWLILSHHKLPFSFDKKTEWKDIANWIDKLEPYWNSPKCNDKDQKERIVENWTFNDNLPTQNFHWLSEICETAKLAKQLNYHNNILHNDVFSSHMARLALMLADHYYSALNFSDSQKQGKRQPNYAVYANTCYDENGQKQYKQQLDEHLIGVANTAENICENLPKFRHSLLGLENETLSEPVKKSKETEKFLWQNKAVELAEKIGDTTTQHGFFGINMASTGYGKTLANAKIMNAIGEQTGKVRFSVALGLRSLTLQTGRAFGDKLGLTDELAVAVGGISVKTLFENQIAKQENQNQPIDNRLTDNQSLGSESADTPINPEITSHYQGKIAEHSLSNWTANKKEIEHLIQAPVLVCTIDHLMPATEGIRGGQQIAPMLRLLSSDLILDEPDDFGEKDLPALTRLIYWAGMLGSRVLLSTATMPPILAYACFEAYQAGFRQFAKANLEGFDDNIQCAWFDELLKPISHQINGLNEFRKQHDQFVQNRIAKLKEKSPKHIGKIIEMQSGNHPYEIMANTLFQGIQELHQNHHISHQDKHISIGLVRMANIDPMIATAKLLVKQNAPADTCIHYCVYHSRYPLAIRSHIEEKLDRILNRKNADDVFRQPEIQEILKKSDVKNHIFVIIASPVAEVGRDHDYDWAIIEPSSVRSIVQTAGRVLRHRDIFPNTPNIYLLNQNIKALKCKKICFNKPGFESNDFKLSEHQLNAILKQVDYENISSASKIMLPDDFKTLRQQAQNNDLSVLEHKVLFARLLENPYKNQASHWWKQPVHWTGEVQYRQRFRESKQEDLYYLWLKSKHASVDFYHCEPKQKFDISQYKSAKNVGQDFVLQNEVKLGERCAFWFDLSPENVYQTLMDDLQMTMDKTYSWEEISQKFGEVKIVQYGDNAETLYYHENFGVYRKAD